ncbi:MAG: FAD-dependent oxidoreductase [Anaerolineae bacterium]|nr:FAD-dependent oxidoreductase [Anaerolineae bacterium]
MSPNDCDVVIIGGGAIGVTAAYYLMEAGRTVTIIEQGEIASGSSFANAGLIVPSFSTPLAEPGALAHGLKWMLNPDSPFYIKPRLDPALMSWLWRFGWACRRAQAERGLAVLQELSLASLALLEELLAAESLDCGYRQAGLLMTYRTRTGWQAGLDEFARAQSFGIQVQVLSEAETLHREPALRPGFAGSIFLAQDAHLDPAKFVQGLAVRLAARGASLHTDTMVKEIMTANGQITGLRTTRGEFHPKQVVLAAGAWSPGLARSLKLRLPVQAAKGYSLTLPHAEVIPRTPLYLSEAKVAVTPLEAGLRLAGTLELAGMDQSISPRRVETMLQAAKDSLYLHDEHGQIEPWSGLRPCTPDGIPVISRAPQHKNLFVAAGHCMLGISLAAITGKLIAQLACGQTPDVAMEATDIRRFGKR